MIDNILQLSSEILQSWAFLLAYHHPLHHHHRKLHVFPHIHYFGLRWDLSNFLCFWLQSISCSLFIDLGTVMLPSKLTYPAVEIAELSSRASTSKYFNSSSSNSIESSFLTIPNFLKQFFIVASDTLFDASCVHQMAISTSTSLLQKSFHWFLGA